MAVFTSRDHAGCPQPEEVMRKTSLLAAAILLSAAAGAPDIARAIEGSSPAAPTEPSTQTQQGSQTATKKPVKKPKSDKSSAVEEFYKGWHTAYALIYDKADYVSGITV